MKEADESKRTPASAGNSTSHWHADARAGYLARHRTPGQKENGQFAIPGEQTHRHHWKIDEPNGPTSHGACAGCGAEKVFKNWLESSDFITTTEQRMMGDF